MNAFCREFVIAWVALASITAPAGAKRMPFSPVVAGGIRYSAQGDGREQYVVASEVSSSNLLWKVKVFHNDINFAMEEDVQWVFITDLKLLDNFLLVRDERSRCYCVDLGGKQVKKQQCGDVFSK
jgi:hypothetical protein